MEIKQWKIKDIIQYKNNPRINNQAVDKTAMSIEEYGWQQPIVVDSEGVIIVGHTRLKAAKKLKLKTCPVVVAGNLTAAQAKAYRIADNKTGELSTWDEKLLDAEIKDLLDMDFDIELTGFLQEDPPLKKKEEEKGGALEYGDNNCEMPIVPNFFERHQCFIIVTHNEIDENFIREYFNLNRNYKSVSGDKKERRTNVIDVEEIRYKCV